MTKNIDIGNVLSRIFKIYGDQAAVLLPVAAAVFLVQALIVGVLLTGSVVLTILAVLVGIVFTTLYSGMVVELVSDVQDGRRDHSVGSLFSAVTGVVVPLILAGLLVGVMAALGFILLIVPGLIVLTFFAVVSPSIVLERKGVMDALQRSRELVKGNGWQVFGVIAVVFLITFVVGAIIGAIGGSAGTAGRVIAEFISSTLTAPIGALAAAVLYFELLRARGEAAAAPDAPGPDAVPAGLEPSAPSGSVPPPPPRPAPSEADRAFGDPQPPSAPPPPSSPPPPPPSSPTPPPPPPSSPTPTPPPPPPPPSSPTPPPPPPPPPSAPPPPSSPPPPSNP